MSKHTHCILWTALLGVLLINILSMVDSRLTGTVSQESIVICHVPPDPDETMTILANALKGHLKHGDYEGPCQTSSSSAGSNVSSIDSSSSADFSATSSSSSETSSSSSSSSSMISESPSSSSTSSSSSQSSEAVSSDVPHWAADTSSVEQTRSVSIAGGGGGGWVDNTPIFRGHGLGEHASVLDFVLHMHGLEPSSTDSFGTGSLPIDNPAIDQALRAHAAICSMSRYFQQLLIARPTTPDFYVEWIATRLANTIGEDPDDMKEALLGRPHHHTKENTLPEDMHEEKCGADPYLYAPSLEEPIRHGQHTDESHPMEMEGTLPDLHIMDESTDRTVDFSVMQGTDIFKDYGTSLTHEMHLIIVRDDFRSFYHIHPKRDAFGVWHIPFTPEMGGTYWLYANFADKNGHSYALRFIRNYPGATGPVGMTIDISREREVDGYRIRLEPMTTPDGMAFAYHITDASGEPARLENFMGAFGHSVIISTEGFFIHSHPSMRANGDPIFYVDTPPGGFSRIFTQFQINGTVHTVVFDWAH